MTDDGETRASALHLTLRQSARARFHALVSERPLIAHVRAGVKRIEAGDRRVDFEAGAIGLLPPRVPFTITNLPPARGPYLAEALVVHEDLIAALKLPDLADPTDLPGPCPARASRAPRVAAAFARAFAAAADPTRPERLRRNAVEEVLLWLAEEGIGFGRLRPPGLVDRLRAAIGAAPEASWQAAPTARLLGVSEATMRRRLAQAGTSFSDTLADVRMSIALELLQSSTMSVTRVALEVGYASPSRFAIRFRARFGIAPSEIRGGAAIERRGTETDRAGAEARRGVV